MDLESATMAMHADALRRQCITTSSAATRIIKKRKPFSLDPATPVATSSAAGPLTAVLAPAPALICPEPRELDVIAKLQRGDGLSSYEVLGLVEQCGICKLFFTSSVLCRHIFVCPCSEV